MSHPSLFNLSFSIFELIGAVLFSNKWCSVRDTKQLCSNLLNIICVTSHNRPNAAFLQLNRVYTWWFELHGSVSLSLPLTLPISHHFTMLRVKNQLQRRSFWFIVVDIKCVCRHLSAIEMLSGLTGTTVSLYFTTHSFSLTHCLHTPNRAIA